MQLRTSMTKTQIQVCLLPFLHGEANIDESNNHLLKKWLLICNANVIFSFASILYDEQASGKGIF